MDCKPVICYVYTNVSCYAIIYDGFGDSGIQRGRYGGLNYVLCLETTPRQRLTTHPNDQELKCQQCVLYGNCLKTTLHVVVEQLVNRPRLYRWYLHALHQWRHYFPVLCRFIRNRSRSRVATWFGCVPSTELQSGRRHSWRRRWRYSIWFVQTRLSVNCVTPPTIFPL